MEIEGRIAFIYLQSPDLSQASPLLHLPRTSLAPRLYIHLLHPTFHPSVASFCPASVAGDGSSLPLGDARHAAVLWLVHHGHSCRGFQQGGSRYVTLEPPHLHPFALIVEYP